MENVSETFSEFVWALEGRGRVQQQLSDVRITSTPFRVGRHKDASLHLPLETISKFHAEFEVQDNSLLVRDMRSTNGTFVNGDQIKGEKSIHDGDVIQFANVVFGVRQRTENSLGHTVEEIPFDWTQAIVRFDRLMTERAVVPFYQPIVSPEGNRCVGYEMLARSHVDGLETPAAMFNAAGHLDQEEELSRMLRQEGARMGTHIPDDINLFFNTHPKEIVTPQLIDSLRELRQVSGERAITLEIHEHAVTDPTALRQLRNELRSLDMQLAYDDFGSGQARLIELSEVRPEYVKFDYQLIHNLHLASAQRHEMIATLVTMVNSLGIASVAEGIECNEEAELCWQLGFDYAQGFHYGKPQRIPFDNNPTKNHLPDPYHGA